MVRLAQCMPVTEAALLDTGCCGMAGAFGMLEAKLTLSKQVAAPLIEKIQRQPPGTLIVAAGTSCRQQIHHLAGVQPLHIAEALALGLPRESAD